MARQDGIIKLHGKIGELSFYKSKKEGFLARGSRGIQGQRILTDPRFERTRENMAEFARAGSATKLLRTALREVLQGVADSAVTGRLSSAMMRVIQADKINSRGKRNVIDGETELLTGFEFNENGKLYGTLLAPFTPTFNRETGSLSVIVPPFVPKIAIVAPPASTHVKLTMTALELDFENRKFTVSNSSIPEIDLGLGTVDVGTLTASVTPASEHPLFIALGVTFSQHVNGTFYPLQNGFFNALALVAVDGGV